MDPVVRCNSYGMVLNMIHSATNIFPVDKNGLDVYKDNLDLIV